MPLIKAMPVHTPRIGVGTRPVKALDATMAAEQMLCSTCTEAVGGEGLLAPLEYKIAVRDNQMEKAGARTHRAIAVEQIDTWRRVEAETNRSAMAATG